jgi:hypothetical protein
MEDDNNQSQFVAINMLQGFSGIFGFFLFLQISFTSSSNLFSLLYSFGSNRCLIKILFKKRATKKLKSSILIEMHLHCICLAFIVIDICMVSMKTINQKFVFSQTGKFIQLNLINYKNIIRTKIFLFSKVVNYTHSCLDVFLSWFYTLLCL